MNAVQMASVYATIANGGVRVQPSIVAGTVNGSRDVHARARAEADPGDPAEDRQAS